MVNMDTFKRMCRLLDLYRRLYLEKEWKTLRKNTIAEKLSLRQMNYLMTIRFSLPCNLNQVMLLTGLSSSAASVFIDNMVRSGILKRKTDPRDRRHILIVPVPGLSALFGTVDRELDFFIGKWMEDLAPEELRTIQNAGEIICARLKLRQISGKEIRSKSVRRPR